MICSAKRPLLAPPGGLQMRPGLSGPQERWMTARPPLSAPRLQPLPEKRACLEGYQRKTRAAEAVLQPGIHYRLPQDTPGREVFKVMGPASCGSRAARRRHLSVSGDR